MKSCDNNCEAVADLHESSVNIIEYSKLFNAWLNGPQNATVNIGGMQTPTLRNLAMAIKQLVGVWPDDITIKIDPTTKKIYVPLKTAGGVHVDNSGLYIDSSDFLQLGGGLAKDANGLLYVDFDQMPTDKFDSILDTFRKGLRLPKWATANMTFYVNKNFEGSSDTLDEGRGLTAQKPFKTIQAAVNNIASNYNLGKFVATILVANATYDGGLELGEFQRSTGYVTIVPQSTSPAVLIQNTSTSKGAVTVTGGSWQISGMALRSNYPVDEATDADAVQMHTLGVSNAALGLFGCSFAAVSTGIATKNTSTAFYLVRADNGAQVTIYGRTGSNMGMSVSKQDTNNKVGFTGLSANGGLITLAATSDMNVPQSIAVAGNYSTFATASNKGQITRTAGRPNRITFSGNITGKRYDCSTGGSIISGNGGPDLFPGNEAGSVDASTYSWYK